MKKWHGGIQVSTWSVDFSATSIPSKNDNVILMMMIMYG